MKSAVTLCRVPESSAGPFVFHQDLESGFREAAALGFDAVELFLPGPEAVTVEEIRSLCAAHGLAVAAVGTGAGMVRHGLSLTDPDPGKRSAALGFVLGMIDFGGRLGAPAILGSMQGRYGGKLPREEALDHLAAALDAAGKAASEFGQVFLYEPLNRYETDLFHRLLPAAEFLQTRGIAHVMLLADLFHLSIEEADIAAAIRDAAPFIGHVHWADSNRHAMGYGHTDAMPLAMALHDAGYTGYLSAEVFPLPDARAAARQTMESIRTVQARLLPNP